MAIDEPTIMKSFFSSTQRKIPTQTASIFNTLGAMLFLIFLLSTCTPHCNDCQNPLKGTEFFPLNIGHFVEYDVNEEEIILGHPSVVVRQYQIKELIADSYTDPAGKTVYRMARFRRNLDGQPWQPDSTLTLRLQVDHAIRNENGRDFVKMLFPPSEKLSWNGNLYNTLGEDTYELKNINQSLKVGGTTFEHTVTVVQQNDSTLVNQDKRVEIYAAEVGLVYRERVNVQFCSSSPACVGKAQIDFGTRQVVRFRKTGKE